jgi:hypothetical protein
MFLMFMIFPAAAGGVALMGVTAEDSRRHPAVGFKKSNISKYAELQVNNILLNP